MSGNKTETRRILPKIALGAIASTVNPEMNVLRKTEIVSIVVRLVISKLFVTAEIQTEIPDHTNVVQRKNVRLLLIDHLDTIQTPTMKIFEKIPPKEEMKSASIKNSTLITSIYR